MDVYETRDLPLAAFLRTYNLPLLEPTTQTVGSKIVVMFRFERTPYLRDHIAGFYSGEGKVSALDYSRNLRILKSGVAEILRGQR